MGHSMVIAPAACFLLAAQQAPMSLPRSQRVHDHWPALMQGQHSGSLCISLMPVQVEGEAVGQNCQSACMSPKPPNNPLVVKQAVCCRVACWRATCWVRLLAQLPLQLHLPVLASPQPLEACYVYVQRWQRVLPASGAVPGVSRHGCAWCPRWTRPARPWGYPFMIRRCCNGGSGAKPIRGSASVWVCLRGGC